MIMGLLFVMPTWAAPLVLWIRRTLDAPEPDLAYIVCRHPRVRRWHDRIPAIDLSPPIVELRRMFLGLPPGIVMAR